MTVDRVAAPGYPFGRPLRQSTAVTFPPAVGRGAGTTGGRSACTVPSATARRQAGVVNQPCHVLVADDHHAAREALSTVVAKTPGLVLVAALDSGEGAEAYAEAADAPLLVVMDVRMPGIGGLEAARRIVGSGAGHVVMLVSSDDEPDQWGTEVQGTTFLAKSRVTGGRLLEAWHLGRQASQL